ncbi:MAG: M48 family metalloprotease [Flavobacteriaceae bacterium]
MTYFLAITAASFVVLSVQNGIYYLFLKDKTQYIFKENLISMVGLSLVLGLLISSSEYIYGYFKLEIVFVLLFSMALTSFWFIINPFQYFIHKDNYQRDRILEKELTNKGYLNYRVLISKKLKDNALATGIVPFFKQIIIAQNLKDDLTKDQINAIIMHEIGHHRKHHITALFIINALLQTSAFYILSAVHSLEIQEVWKEMSLIAITGGLMGLAYYYIPGKIMYYLEYQADSYAAQIMGKEVTSSALIKLDELSGGKLTKGNINHPNLKKRLANIQKS